MPQYRDMTENERKCYDAAYDGFYMSGAYDVSFGNHRRVIEADSIRWLAREILGWFENHLESSAEKPITVRFVEAF